MTPQEKGALFETDFAKKLGLSRVPGSGAVWHSKLDVHGKGGRWSLKFTEKPSFTITRKLIEEALAATQGLGGDGSLPLWAICIEPLGTFVLMRDDDFVQLAAGQITLAQETSKAEARMRRASVPELLRDE